MKSQSKPTNKKPVIAVDIDDVLFPFVQEFVKYYNKVKGTQVTVDDFLTYDFDKILKLPVNQTQKHIYDHYELDLQHIEPVKEAQVAIEHLAKDFDLILLTARHPDYDRAISAWLQQRFGKAFKSLIMVGHHRTVINVRKKVEVCQELNAMALIDDSPTHISECAEAGIKGVLFGDYPWNQGELPDGAVRCNNWQEVLEYFDGTR